MNEKEMERKREEGGRMGVQAILTVHERDR